MQELIDAIADMMEDKVLELTQKYLDEGKDPAEIFDAYQSAMEEIGRRFEANTYFVPELIMAGEMMKAGSELIKPHLKEDAAGDKSGKIGKYLIATIEGDIHDIGKNIVGMILDLNGFEVMDLGVDVPADKIIEAAKEFQPDIIGLSGLLTLAFDPMKAFVEKLTAEGLRDKFKVMIGGAQMDQQVCEYIGADAWVTDAVAGVNKSKEWLAA
ncbi:Methanogenic corrinoid protein MtbC1 [Desulfatibacillum alkenivorans DSM 16219]|jgi:5-methyltetrahydrofolate--homocysteine methyltransferase|uniref:Methanogenic corrinoid protein MtbC1 n=1 Tax=Desulfatibacillum alkenivorans DSM 16219 TaxID=1121393 RepID=A0A1M6QQP3_9BACT|nr:cobalamin-dependent protein [Desulfatibacillum alkenivorans]SHK22526.1 Methanogenic corrinoid protein MtbC1 [Desulfatibacillum alkenivorans DSM 16219]